MVLLFHFLCGSTATCRPGGGVLLAAVASGNALPARPRLQGREEAAAGRAVQGGGGGGAS